MRTNIYDIHGFVISVDDLANAPFQKEYSHFKIDRVSSNRIDLFVRASLEREMFPTKPVGSDKGLYLPFGEDDNVLRYNLGVDLNFIFFYAESLLWWSDKTFLHAAAVSKDNKAYVFTGGANVGKTSIVLNVVKKGLTYLSDDWLIIGGGKAYPYPKTVHIFDYNLRDKKTAITVLGRRRFYYNLVFKLFDFCTKLSPHRYFRFAFDSVRPRFDVNIQEIFSKAKIGTPVSISKVFYLERTDTKEIEIKQDLKAKDLARIMAYMNQYEWNHLYKEYYKYAFRYNVKNLHIENRLQHDMQIMYDTFKQVNLYRVLIPRETDLTKMTLDEFFQE